MEIIFSFFSQLIFTVGVIIIFGLLIALCRKAFCKIVGDNGTKILLATGIVGTPIHELSHALMCILFGHKITSIKLYQPNSNDGTLGYVEHSYNPKNLYQRVGNFFIGIAPILGGSGVILLLMFLLVPDIFYDMQSELAFISLITFDLLDISTYLAILELFWSVIEIIFGFTNMGSILWWVFFLLAFMISNHMELSTADIKGGLSGLLVLVILLLIADIVMYFISLNILEDFTNILVSFSASITGFLAVSAVFSGIMLMAAIAIKGVIKVVNK